MEFVTGRAEDGGPRRESLLERGDGHRLEVVAAPRHRGLVHHDEHVAVAPYLGDVVDQAIERIGADPDAPDPDRSSGRAEPASQVVEGGRIGKGDGSGHTGSLANSGSTASNKPR
jgi:hypothetical protein